MTKNFCALLILTLVIGCGKKANEIKPITSRDYQQGELSKDLILEVDEEISSTTIFDIPRNALFKLPTELTAKDGHAIGKKITIFYNYSNSNEYKFKCTYKSTDHDTTLAFEKCDNRDGQIIVTKEDNIEDVWFTMVLGYKVKLQLTNPTGTGMKIDSVYLMDWK